MEFIPYVPAFIVPAGMGLAALLGLIFGGGAAGAGAAAGLGAFGGGGSGGASPPIDPYTGQVMGVDPNTGLNQRVVDTLWNQPTPEGYQFTGDPASYIDSNGLPRWITTRLEWAQGKNANWLQFFKDNVLFTGALPAELVTLLTAPWGTIESDDPSYRTQQPNEGDQTSYPEGQQPTTVDGQPTFETTVFGNPQTIPGGFTIPSGMPQFATNVFAPQDVNPQYVPTGIEPNPNNVPDYVAPPPNILNQSPAQPPLPQVPTFSTDVWGTPITTPTPPPIINQPTPDFSVDVWGTPIPTPPSVPSPMPPQVPPGVPPGTTPSPIPGAPTTTTPPPVDVPPPTPEIPNIPVSLGGGGGAAIPPSFPVVGDGNPLSSLFQALPPISVPPSIIEFLKRRQA